MIIDLISSINFALACLPTDEISLIRSIRRILNDYEEKMSHKKIMSKAAKALDKDVKHYKREEKADKKHHDTRKLKHHKQEEKEARSASKDLKKRVKKAHE